VVPPGPKKTVTIADPVDLTSTTGATTVVDATGDLGAAYQVQNVQDDIRDTLQSILQGSTDTVSLDGTGRDDNGCGSGWANYGPPDKANGGRSTGIEACITQAMINTGKDPSSNPPGYQWAQDFATYLGVSDAKLSVNACHLLGKQLGGFGGRPNLATCGRSTNAARQDPTDPGRNGPMVEFEDAVRDEVEGGATVHYQVTPEYLGNRTVPYAFVMVAESSTGEWAADVVPNVVYSPRQNAWVNIGQASCPTSACSKPLPTPGVR
jgi:hypothetical protein